MAELLINGKNAFTEWGVRMGEDFLDTLNGYYTLKEYITNNDRTQDGVQYVGIPKVNERNMTLNFTIEGNSASSPPKIKLLRRLCEKGILLYRSPMIVQIFIILNILEIAAPLQGM